jgi:hypothetical protein
VATTDRDDGEPLDRDAIVKLIKKSCIIVIGATDFYQCSEYGGNWPCTRYPFFQSTGSTPLSDVFYIPNPEDPEDDRIFEALQKKIYDKGAILIILSGWGETVWPETDMVAMEDGSFDGYACNANYGDGGQDGGSDAYQFNNKFICGEAGGNICTESQTEWINIFLEKMRDMERYEPPEHIDVTGAISFPPYTGWEHWAGGGAANSFRGAVKYQNLMHYQYTGCTSCGCAYHDCSGGGAEGGPCHCADYFGDPDGDPDRTHVGCDWCGKCGEAGHTPGGLYNYNLFKVGADVDSAGSWLNNLEDDGIYNDDPSHPEYNPFGYQEDLVLQKWLMGLVYGGVELHDLTNIDGYGIVETGFAIERFGEGYIVAWADPATFSGHIDGDSGTVSAYNHRFICRSKSYNEEPCDTTQTMPYDDYGYKPYEDNSWVLSKLIYKLIGKEVPEVLE